MSGTGLCGISWHGASDYRIGVPDMPAGVSMPGRGRAISPGDDVPVCSFRERFPQECPAYRQPGDPVGGRGCAAHC